MERIRGKIIIKRIRDYDKKWVLLMIKRIRGEIIIKRIRDYDNKWVLLMIKRIRGTGRNNQGKITVRHRGRGDKIVSIKEKKIPEGIYKIKRIEGWRIIEIINKITKLKYKIKRTLDISPGREIKVLSKERKELKEIKYKKGDMVPIQQIKEGEIIWDIKGYGCSSGSKIIKMEENKVKLPSGEIKQIKNKEIVKIGIGNIKPIIFKEIAGTKRHLGIRPRVKGERMNSVDHPNGGRTRKGRISKTKWGKIAKL